MAPTTPTGSRTMRELPTSSSKGNSVASWAAAAKLITGNPTWMRFDSVKGMPTSWEISVAISSVRAVSASCTRARILARSSLDVDDHSAKASAAHRTARSTSSGVPSGIVPMTSSVAELTTSITPVPVEDTQAPPM